MVDSKESSRFAKAEDEGVMRLGSNAALGVTKLSPYTSFLSIYGSMYNTMERSK